MKQDKRTTNQHIADGCTLLQPTTGYETLSNLLKFRYPLGYSFRYYKGFPSPVPTGYEIEFVLVYILPGCGCWKLCVVRGERSRYTKKHYLY